MAVGDVWRIAFVGHSSSQQYVEVFHVRFKSVAATIAGAVTALKTDWNDVIKGICVTGWGIDRAHCRGLVVPSPVYDVAAVSAGVVATDPLPPQAAIVVTWRTGIAGRNYRGRTFIGGQAEVSQSAGTWDGPMIASLQTSVNTLLGKYGSGGTDPDYELGVWSRVLGGDDPGPYNLIAGFHVITTGVARPYVYNQRRRTIGVGA